MKRFIHIPKNGGYSIRKQFRKKFLYTSSNDLVSGEYLKQHDKQMAKYNEHGDPGHARWQDLNPRAQQDTCFAIIRNPWDRTVARYTFMMKAIKKGRDPKNLYTKKTFEEFLEERHKWGNVPFFWHRAIHNWYPQKDHVVDKAGVNKCDVLRFEHYQEDTTSYLNVGHINYHNVSNGDIVNDRTQVVKRKDYKEFYNDKTIQTVADWYKDDVEFFGFDFDTTAIKNIWVS